MKKTIKQTKPAKRDLPRSREEQTLENSELRYRRLFETTQDGILILDAKTGAITDVNPYLIAMLGYSREEFIEKKLWEVGAFIDVQASKDAFETLQKNEYIRYENLPLKTKDGRLIQVEFVSNVYLVGKAQVIQCNIRDITEHKRLVAALQENQKKYHTLVTSSPDGIFLIDLSGNFISVNQVLCGELGFSNEELQSMNIWDMIPEQFLDEYKTRLTKILNGESLIEPSEYAVRGKDGKILFIEVLSAPYYSEKGIIGFQGIARAVTARKRAEEALRESEEHFRALVENSSDLIAVLNQDGTLRYSSPAVKKVLGYTVAEATGKSIYELVHPEDVQTTLQAVADRLEHPDTLPGVMEIRARHADGSWRILEGRGDNLLNNQGVKGIVLNFHDITERKQVEETLQKLSQKDEEALRLAHMGRWEFDMATAQFTFNDQYYSLHGITAEEVGGYQMSVEKFASRYVHPDDGQIIGNAIQQAIKTNDPNLHIHREARILRADGEPRNVSTWFRVEKDPQGRTTKLLGVNQDITERKRAELEIARQLERLETLHTIDLAISASMDLHLTLNVLLEHVKTQLNADATDVLLLNPHLQTLEFAAGRGFKSRAVERTSLRIGEGQAGRAALERHMIQLPDFAASGAAFAQAELLAAENVASYFAVPLIAKGQVKGVLEVFHRTPLQPDSEWLNFLETLAGQAAIAIDSGQLFENLQRSNSDLGLAYDATIEGWSHALDLRDKETEGHTQRVTEITLRLAKAMGIGEAELVHVRRGALLHDIGKMGVPDEILLKSGKLTDEEWVLMRKHPQLAYDLLCPIAYLKPALDIPYCHHEKWDGTGYPRGLKGNQIPLAARLFAVIDVWDALTSDRPYRPAWSKEKALEHIRSVAGTHFDPQVVEAFLREIAGE